MGDLELFARPWKENDPISLSDFAQPWTEEDEKECIERKELQSRNSTDKQSHDAVSDLLQST
jgi:hypothetical protein